MKVGIKNIKHKVLPILKEAGAIRSSIFGSFVRGENKKNSDIDILVDLPKEKSLLEFIKLKFELEKALGKKVDLIEYSTIKPRLQSYILKSQIQIL